MATKARAPQLCVIIDTEEEFDWNAPFDRRARAVTSIPAQQRAQDIFARYGLVPSYVIDHPVADNPEAVAVLKAWQDEGQAVIGAHLHPWVSPPFDEEVNRQNSYPGNLPKSLEYEKLRQLTALIERVFDKRPRLYKAGRYGIGPNSAAILEDLGYQIDASIVPYTDFSFDHGPDFRHETPHLRPFLPARDILELPLSTGFYGLLRKRGASLFPMIDRPLMRSVHLPGIFARLGLLERIRLSPEGQGADDHIRLTKAMWDDGFDVFSYTYHSPSLVPGHTPYVRSPADLDRFLDQMDRYFDFFFNELGGRAATPLTLYQQWQDRGKIWAADL
ncbi:MULTISPECIES: polysaccharide deacetylase family protein [unclassified Iodidimonas]|uniref:polysaccharide deacetylase family protein n=1 Tax=unclassified Iodidimonas TaxID=2626145 RepID=UPI002482E3AF|nr:MULTISPECIES: polysaccharide deacetylase family protein [unclassified Iodidimonas]